MRPRRPAPQRQPLRILGGAAAPGHDPSRIRPKNRCPPAASCPRAPLPRSPTTAARSSSRATSSRASTFARTRQIGRGLDADAGCPSDPNPPAEAISAGISADGQTVLFTSANELTEDANTGESGGVPNDAGADLYSYDVATGELTDLTVDTEPADVATGADVQEVLGASPNADYVYFVALGKLAIGWDLGGAEPLRHPRRCHQIHRHRSRARRPFLRHPRRPARRLHSRARSRAAMTTPASPGLPLHLRRGIECGSCRPGGESPAADASLAGRSLTDDGSRLFFQSADAILPAAQSTLPTSSSTAAATPTC